MLEMRVDRETYNVLGLEGGSADWPTEHKSRAADKRGFRWISLTLDKDVEESNLLQRALWALDPERSAFPLMDAVGGPRIFSTASPGSVLGEQEARQLAAVLSGEVRVADVDAVMVRRDRVLPKLRVIDMAAYGLEAGYEWLAGVLLGSSAIVTPKSHPSAPFVRGSVMGSVGEGEEDMYLADDEWDCVRAVQSGFVDAHYIWEVVQGLAEWIGSEDALGAPWVAITVHGFPHAPTSWGHSQHGSVLSGDNHYTVLLFPDGSFSVVTGVGDADSFTR